MGISLSALAKLTMPQKSAVAGPAYLDDMLSVEGFMACMNHPVGAKMREPDSVEEILKSPIHKAYEELGSDLNRRFGDKASLTLPSADYKAGEILFANVSNGAPSMVLGISYGSNQKNNVSSAIADRLKNDVSEANKMYLKFAILHETGHNDADMSKYQVLGNLGFGERKTVDDVLKAARLTTSDGQKQRALTHLMSVYNESYADAYATIYSRLIYGDEQTSAIIDGFKNQRRMPRRGEGAALSACDTTDRFMHYTGETLDNSMKLNLSKVSSGEDVSAAAKRAAVKQLKQVAAEIGFGDLGNDLERAAKGESNSCDDFQKSLTGLASRIVNRRALDGNGVLMCGKGFKP